MNKTKTLIIRITPEQENLLKAKMQAVGFRKKSDYVRCALFMPSKVNQNG